MPDESAQEGEFFMGITSVSMRDFVPTDPTYLSVKVQEKVPR